MIKAVLSGWLAVATLAIPIFEKSRKSEIQIPETRKINSRKTNFEEENSLLRSIRDSIGQNRLGNTVHQRNFPHDKKDIVSVEYQYVRHLLELNSGLSEKVMRKLRHLHKKSLKDLKSRKGSRRLSKRGHHFIKVQLE